VPALSFLADNLHERLAEDSEITHSVVVDCFTVTVPVGVEPEYCGDTVTERFRTCSCP
jgi:hypothetical protein